MNNEKEHEHDWKLDSSSWGHSGTNQVETLHYKCECGDTKDEQGRVQRSDYD